MKNKSFVRIVAIVLAVLMLLSVVLIALDFLVGNDASARVTQSQIDTLRATRREYERRRRDVESQINSFEFERATEIAKKEVLDRRIEITGAEIENITEIISYYSTLIREKEYDVFLASVREEEQLAAYRARVRDMEENGVITYLEIIFDSTSFSDLLARIDFIGDIMRADEQAYLDLIQARDETEAAQEALEETRDSLADEQILLEERKAELDGQLEEAQELIERISDDLDASRELHAKYQADSDRILREINSAEAELERQRERDRQERLRRQQASQQRNTGSSNTGGGTVVGTGELMRPVSGGRISSPFGTRRHPVFGNMRFHGGIDFAVPHGSSVFAADSGTVVISTYNASFGNYIVLSHGNGVNTLYAHLSARHVSVGASVSRGQVIGLVGSTGISTGPHLHFEVHVNGSRVNPATRLP